MGNRSSSWNSATVGRTPVVEAQIFGSDAACVLIPSCSDLACWCSLFVHYGDTTSVRRPAGRAP